MLTLHLASLPSSSYLEPSVFGLVLSPANCDSGQLANVPPDSEHSGRRTTRSSAASSSSNAKGTSSNQASGSGPSRQQGSGLFGSGASGSGGDDNDDHRRRPNRTPPQSLAVRKDKKKRTKKAAGTKDKGKGRAVAPNSGALEGDVSNNVTQSDAPQVPSASAAPRIRRTRPNAVSADSLSSLTSLEDGDGTDSIGNATIPTGTHDVSLGETALDTPESGEDVASVEQLLLSEVLEEDEEQIAQVVAPSVPQQVATVNPIASGPTLTLQPVDPTGNVAVPTPPAPTGQHIKQEDVEIDFGDGGGGDPEGPDDPLPGLFDHIPDDALPAGSPITLGDVFRFLLQLLELYTALFACGVALRESHRALMHVVPIVWDACCDWMQSVCNRLTAWLAKREGVWKFREYPLRVLFILP